MKKYFVLLQSDVFSSFVPYMHRNCSSTFRVRGISIVVAEFLESKIKFCDYFTILFSVFRYDFTPILIIMTKSIKKWPNWPTLTRKRQIFWKIFFLKNFLSRNISSSGNCRTFFQDFWMMSFFVVFDTIFFGRIFFLKNFVRRKISSSENLFKIKKLSCFTQFFNSTVFNSIKLFNFFFQKIYQENSVWIFKLGTAPIFFQGTYQFCWKFFSTLPTSFPIAVSNSKLWFWLWWRW